jgi:hypothetical protein
MLKRLLPALTFLLACSDDDSTKSARDAASLNDATIDAGATSDAASTLLDADLRVDTDCFSPLHLLPPDAGFPSGAGCDCDPTLKRDGYCLGNAQGAPYVLLCTGKWNAATDGTCASFTGGGATKSCAERRYDDVPDSGVCPRGFAPVAAELASDGGLASPPCCDAVRVTVDECLRGGFRPAALDLAGDSFVCRDGRLPLADIDGFEPSGCCAN